MSESAKRALVTGGSGGIGAAICRELAGAGHHVYVHAHKNAAGAEAVVHDIKVAGGSAEAVLFDVTDGDVARAALEAITASEPVQILVNNAGLHDDAAFPGMSVAQWNRVIDVAVDGFYNVTQPLVLPMIRTRWGRIISISSVTAVKGNRGQVNYAAAKGALHSATKALALEVATRGITVNAVAPGIIATGMSTPLLDDATIADLVPMKRAGTAAEVASLVGYLASDAARYITAQIISVNGGMA